MSSPTKTGHEWHQCPANARHVSDDGKERVVACNEELHADPSDGTVWHYDEPLDIYWRYADGQGYDDTEADPVMYELREA